MLRKIQPSDAEFLCSIFKDNEEYYNIFFDSETRVSEWEKRIQLNMTHEEWQHFIIVEDEVDVGWLAWECTSKEEWDLIIIVIKREFLSKGYGTKAFSEFIEKARQDGVKRIFLYVNADNPRAIRFYEKFGFVIYDKEIVPESNEKINNEEYKMKLELGRNRKCIMGSNHMSDDVATFEDLQAVTKDAIAWDEE